MDWTLIVEVLVAVIGGSVITRFLTFREMKNGMRLDNETKIEENKNKSVERWSTLCNELQDQVERFQGQIDGLNERLEKKDILLQEKDDTIAELRTKLDTVRTQCSVATLLRCRKISCPDRIPPISEAFTGNIDEQMTKYIEEM